MAKRIPYLQVEEIFNDMRLDKVIEDTDQKDDIIEEFTDRADDAIVCWAPEAEEDYDNHSDLYIKFWKYVIEREDVEPGETVCVDFF